MPSIADILGEIKCAELSKAGVRPKRKRVSERVKEEVASRYAEACKRRTLDLREKRVQRAARIKTELIEHSIIVRIERKKRSANKNTRALFEEGQTHPSPKRQGRANSHSDIGKYVSCGPTSMESIQRRATTVFATIHIAGLN